MKGNKTCLYMLLALFISIPKVAHEQSPNSENTSASPEHFTPADSMKILENNPEYVDLSAFPHVKIELKYATTDNFMHLNMYGPFQTAYLHKEAAEKFN